MPQPRWRSNITYGGVTLSGVITYYNTANTPMDNVTVKLTDVTGTNVIATTLTNASGQYTFNNVPAATYKIEDHINQICRRGHQLDGCSSG